MFLLTSLGGFFKCLAWPAGLLSCALNGGGGAGRMQRVCVCAREGACHTAGTAECLFYYFPAADYGLWI